MAHLMHFVALTAVLCCSLTRTITATFWGDWGTVDYCPDGEWTVGFSLKSELPLGGGDDDTALNAIALKCSGGKWIYSTEGPWGNYRGKFICPSDARLTSCQLRVEPPQEKGDDTAANNLNCKCSNGETMNGDGNTWGDWNEWTHTCDKGICALETRVEAKQAKGGDNTALNDVKFTCCQS